MPNHVTQQLSILGADAPKVIEHVAGTESAFDFHKVIPMPEELRIDDSSDGHLGIAAITGQCDKYLTCSWVKEQSIRTAEEFAAYVQRERPKAIDLGRKYLSNQQNFGHATWWGWCVENWGTKWNAYSIGAWEFGVNQAMIRFDTAWSPALPVIARLSELFPSLQFTLRYFDEGWGFAGEACFTAGIHVDDCFAPTDDDLRTRVLYREVYGAEVPLDCDEQ
jgi:hypothetical protein